MGGRGIVLVDHLNVDLARGVLIEVQRELVAVQEIGAVVARVACQLVDLREQVVVLVHQALADGAHTRHTVSRSGRRAEGEVGLDSG